MKCKCIRFGIGKPSGATNLSLEGARIEEVYDFKYLGVTLTYNLRITKDIERANTAFLKQFYGFFSKFSNANLYLKLRLFNMYCTSFYGSSLWTNYTGASKAAKAIRVSYHKAIKKIIGVPYWYGNHDTCNHVNFKTFENLVNLNVINYILQLKKSKSPCIRYMKTYMLYKSNICREANKLVFEEYGFNNIIDNDIDAMNACIYRKQISYVSNIPYDQILSRNSVG